MAKEPGELFEIRSETEFEWKKKDFFLLSDEIDTQYKSPKFYFSGSSWRIIVCPNGTSRNSNSLPGSIAIFLQKVSTGCYVPLMVSLGIQSVRGEADIVRRGLTHADGEKHVTAGVYNVILRAELTKRKSQFTLSNDLTVICTMKISKKHDISGSIFSRYQEISDNLKDIYQKAKRTDFTVKVQGKNIPAHRVILETRSPVFSAMFSHDSKENQTGVISICDMEENAIKGMLEYLYSGDIQNLTTKNVFPHYAAADKYDTKNMKEVCSEFIVRNLSVHWVCDVIKFSKMYRNEELSLRAKEFFKENGREILKTQTWKDFARENHEFSVELLSSILTDVLPK